MGSGLRVRLRPRRVYGELAAALVVRWTPQRSSPDARDLARPTAARGQKRMGQLETPDAAGNDVDDGKLAHGPSKGRRAYLKAALIEHCGL